MQDGLRLLAATARAPMATSGWGRELWWWHNGGLWVTCLHLSSWAQLHEEAQWWWWWDGTGVTRAHKNAGWLLGAGSRGAICSRKDWGETSQTEVGNGNCGTGMLNSSGILGKEGEPFVLTWAAGSTGAPLQYICHCRKMHLSLCPHPFQPDLLPCSKSYPGRGVLGQGAACQHPLLPLAPRCSCQQHFPEPACSHPPPRAFRRSQAEDEQVGSGRLGGQKPPGSFPRKPGQRRMLAAVQSRGDAGLLGGR